MSAGMLLTQQQQQQQQDVFHSSFFMGLTFNHPKFPQIIIYIQNTPLKNQKEKMCIAFAVIWFPTMFCF